VRIEDDPAAWNAFVLAAPGATAAHLWEWGPAIAETYGHPTHHLVARDAHGIAGILPLTEVRSRLFGKSLVSLPYLDTGGIVATRTAAWSGLLAAAAELAFGLGIRRLDLRHAAPPRLAAPARADKVTLVLDLTAATGARSGARTASEAGGRAHAGEDGLASGAEGLWQAIGAKTRNQVRKAAKAGLAVEHTGRAGIDDFYRVWCANMRDLGSPAHRRRWFESLMAHLGERSSCYLVRCEREVIGGLIAVRAQDTVVVPWASSDRRHFALSPNNLLYWTVLRDAVQAGVHRFDFGRSSIGSGTYHFKRQWGAVDVRLYWQEVDALALPAILAPGEEPPAATPPAALEPGRRAQAERLWRRLPVPVATWLGGRVRGGITL
jgi:hypothetical protein